MIRCKTVHILWSKGANAIFSHVQGVAKCVPESCLVYQFH